MQTLTIKDFAKYIGIPYDDVMRLSFSEFIKLIRKHGFYLTGSGLIPKKYTKSK